ncbi:MAG: DNA methyltransferase [Acidimicrobiales bacterium]
MDPATALAPDAKQDGIAPAAAPIFADDLATLYHADCRQQTAWLDADFLVTDPPYGIAWRQGGLLGGTRDLGIVGDDDTSVRDEVLAMWGTTRPAVVFGWLKLAPPKDTPQVLVYRKPPDSGVRGSTAGFRRDIEAVYLLGPWPLGIGGRSSVIETGHRHVGSHTGLAAASGHPHAKPLDVLALLIGLHPGVVADPFCGSGSTLVAARQLGRPAIGVEVTAAYAATAAARLAQGCFAGFGAPAPAAYG